MNRITEKDLDNLCNRLNQLTDNPIEPWQHVKEASGRVRMVANIGNYHIDSAYGGWKLHRMFNHGGGATDVLGTGYIPRRELYDQIHAFINGIYATND